MNRFYSITLSTTLIVWSVAPAVARPKDTTVQARETFEQIDASASEIANVAELLGERAKRQADPEVQMEGLDTLKHDVNSIGKELSALEAERSSLASWEVDALERATSLMLEVAANTEKAIATYNSDRTHLWATSYPADTAKAAEDADQVKTLISSYLKLAKVREREDHLERDLGTAPQF